MKPLALLPYALALAVLLARRRVPDEAVARTGCHGADAEGDALEPDPYLTGLLYWHTASDGRVQQVIQPLAEGRRE